MVKETEGFLPGRGHLTLASASGISQGRLEESGPEKGLGGCRSQPHRCTAGFDHVRGLSRAGLESGANWRARLWPLALRLGQDVSLPASLFS